jgi:1-acyl-sn-glycerol-3-phosphate acyltransferase
MQSLQNVYRTITKLLYKVEVVFEDGPPPPGSIVASNHPGLLDGLTILLTSKSPIRVMAKVEIFETFVGYFIKPAGAISTDWHSPDRSALNEVIQALDDGLNVGIFPEGTRCSGTYEWIRSGIGYVLLNRNRPIYPVAMFGSRLANKSRSWIPFPRSRIVIVIGAPIRITDEELALLDKSKISQIQSLAERLRLELRAFVAKSTQKYDLANLTPMGKEQ